jgi:uncharacterized membrane protein
VQTATLPAATIGGSYAYGWQQLKKYFLYLFLIGIVLFVADIPTNSFPAGVKLDADDQSITVPGSPLLQLLAVAYSLLILPVIKWGGDWLFLRYMRNDQAEISDIAIGFKSGYLNIVLASLLVFAIVLVGFFLLIVPGIILAIRLSFVSYIVMDKRVDPVAAVEMSWSMTRGHSWRILGFALLAIPIFIVGLCLLLVGAFFAYLWIKASFASLYHAIDLETERRLDANGTHGHGGDAARAGTPPP